jgi:hypothetical protein
MDTYITDEGGSGGVRKRDTPRLPREKNNDRKKNLVGPKFAFLEVIY